jgi:geranylgeranyl diphosphate synthase type I
MAAMEMVASACDLIDDIQEDELAIQLDRHSVGLAMEVASILMLLAHSELVRLETKGVAAETALRALRILNLNWMNAFCGQALDIDFEATDDVSIDQSLTATSLKSASLASCAAELGASLGTERVDEINLYAQFGWHLGIALQIVNDVEAVWPRGPEKSDLRLRKKALPVVFALNLSACSSEYARTVQDYYASMSEEANTAHVRWALWRCGAIHFAWMKAASEKAMAQRVAHAIASGSPKPALMQLLV